METRGDEIKMLSELSPTRRFSTSEQIDVQERYGIDSLAALGSIVYYSQASMPDATDQTFVTWLLNVGDDLDDEDGFVRSAPQVVPRAWQDL